MPVLQGRTRLQLQQSVLFNLGALRQLTASAAGTTTTFVTNQMPLGAASDHIGKWLHFTSGANNSGLIRQVTASSVAASVTTLTFAPAITDATANLDTADLIGWQGDSSLHPQRIQEFLSQAIVEITGEYFDPEESLALFSDGEQTRFDIPAEFAMLTRVDVRRGVSEDVIHTCDTAWDESSVPANVTRSVDSEDKKHGGSSVRFVIAGAFTTGKVSSDSITSIDLRKFTHIEFWVKSTTATVAGDFQIILDDANATGDGTDLENLAVPALVALTWTYVRVALVNPALDSAIISVGLRAVNNIAANTIWVDEVRAVNDDTATWTTLDRNSWRVDVEARDLVFVPFNRVGYKLLKIVGGDEPALFTADSTVTEVPEGYLIARATALCLMSGLGSPSMDVAVRQSQANMWMQKAEMDRRALTNMTNVRSLSPS